MSNNDWIEQRRRAGYDFGRLIRAMSNLEIREHRGSLVVDTSALLPEDTNYPTSHILVPDSEDDGVWHHEGAGTAASLLEHIFGAALTCLEILPRPADSDIEVPVTRKDGPHD